MERFFARYAKELDSIALKMIDKDVDKAKELCRMGDRDYIKYLASAHNKISDYFEDKGISPDSPQLKL